MFQKDNIEIVFSEIFDGIDDHAALVKIYGGYIWTKPTNTLG